VEGQKDQKVRGSLLEFSQGVWGNSWMWHADILDGWMEGGREGGREVLCVGMELFMVLNYAHHTHFPPRS